MSIFHFLWNILYRNNKQARAKFDERSGRFHSFSPCSTCSSRRIQSCSYYVRGYWCICSLFGFFSCPMFVKRSQQTRTAYMGVLVIVRRPRSELVGQNLSSDLHLGTRFQFLRLMVPGLYFSLPLVTKSLVDLLLILGIITIPIFFDPLNVVFTVLSSVISHVLLVLLTIGSLAADEWFP